MQTIMKTRQEARDAAAQIHEWRKKNIPRYNATSWANENLSDEEYDKLHKHEKLDQWEVPNPFDEAEYESLKAILAPVDKIVEQVEKLPDGWRAEKDVMGMTKEGE